MLNLEHLFPTLRLFLYTDKNKWLSLTKAPVTLSVLLHKFEMNLTVLFGLRGVSIGIVELK
jgi:hypothetical protein